MSRPRIRKLAVIVGASALVGAAGCGAASSDNASNASNGNGTAPAAAQRPNLSALADKLGVSTSALEKAMQSARPSSGQDPAAALAKALGISETKVREAMQALGPPAGSGPPASGTTAAS
jgi:biotin operon repressor